DAGSGAPERRRASSPSPPSGPGRARAERDRAGAPRLKAATGDAKKAESDKPDRGGKKKPAAGSVAPQDQELDSLLRKLGESKDARAPEERPSGASGALEPKPETRPEKPGATKLGGKDKEIDDRLEEYTGRRKKRSPADEKRSGPVGEIIKEMREVEERLGK